MKQPILPAGVGSDRTHGNRIRFSRFRIVAVGILLLFILAITYGRRERRVQSFRWLSPVESTSYFKSPPYERFEFKILRSWPLLWNLYAKTHCHLNVRNQCYTVIGDNRQLINLDSSSQTSNDGTEAWVLTGAQLTSFRAANRSLLGSGRVFESLITTLEAMQTGVGQLMPADGTPGSQAHSFEMNLRPEIANHKLRLVISAKLIDQDIRAGGVIAASSTNLDVSCLATVPNGGALVVQRSRPDKDYWMVISVQATDATGAPRGL